MNSTKLAAATLSCVLAFLSGALAGATLGRPAAEGQMLAGGAIVAIYMLAGAIIATASVAYLCWRWPSGRIWKLAVGLFVATLALGVYTRYPLTGRRTDRVEKVILQRAGDSLADLRRGGGEAVEGLGFVRVPFPGEGLQLFFYGDADYASGPVDSLIYETVDNRLLLRYAPPYLLPYYLKEDYESLYFRLSGIHRNRAQIVLNDDTGRGGWVEREKVEVLFWPDFLATVFAVYPLDPTQNPVRQRPLSAADPESGIGPDELLLAQWVEGDWIYVKGFTEGDAEAGFGGWLRWREGDRLLVGWDYRL